MRGPTSHAPIAPSLPRRVPPASYFIFFIRMPPYFDRCRKLVIRVLNFNRGFSSASSWVPDVRNQLSGGSTSNHATAEAQARTELAPLMRALWRMGSGEYGADRTIENDIDRDSGLAVGDQRRLRLRAKSVDVAVSNALGAGSLNLALEVLEAAASAEVMLGIVGDVNPLLVFAPPDSSVTRLNRVLQQQQRAALEGPPDAAKVPTGLPDFSARLVTPT